MSAGIFYQDILFVKTRFAFPNKQTENDES